MKRVIETKNAPGAVGPYSQGYEVNGLVFTSGQLPGVLCEIEAIAAK